MAVRQAPFLILNSPDTAAEAAKDLLLLKILKEVGKLKVENPYN